MKKTILLGLLALIGFGTFSCEKKPETPIDPLFEQQVFVVSEVMFQRFLFEINLSFYKGLEKNGMIGTFLLNPNEVDCTSTTYNWDAGTKSMIINYGTSCVPSTGFRKSGKITIRMTHDIWQPGTTAMIELSDLEMEQRSFDGSIDVQHGDIVFGDTYRQTISYQSLLFTHEDSKNSLINGTFPAQVNRSNGILVSYEIQGQGSGIFKGSGAFVTQVRSPLQFAIRCRDLGKNGLTGGLMQSILDFSDIQTFIGTGTDCSEQLTLRLGGQVRNIPF